MTTARKRACAVCGTIGDGSACASCGEASWREVASVPPPPPSADHQPSRDGRQFYQSPRKARR